MISLNTSARIPQTVATHDGNFHADDLTALSIICRLNPELRIVRTKDKTIQQTLDARVDTGGRYDPTTGDFDHHQKEFTLTRENGVPFASAGLVWKEFGFSVVGDLAVQQIVDERFIQGVDAADVGYKQAGSNVHAYTLTEIVRSLNATADEVSENKQECCFNLALSLFETFLDRAIEHAKEILTYNVYVREQARAFANKPYLLLDKDGDWGATGIVEDPLRLYVIHPAIDGTWRLRTIPVPENKFIPKKSLPLEWSGLSGAELVAVTGVTDALFCTKGRFMVSAKSYEGAMQLMELALNRHE